jgi:hypothetical protein
MAKKYLKKVADTAAYATFKAGEEFVTPNVTLVGADTVEYNPIVAAAE